MSNIGLVVLGKAGDARSTREEYTRAARVSFSSYTARPQLLKLLLHKLLITCNHRNHDSFRAAFLSPVPILSIMLYKVVLTFESVEEILSVTIQMNATEQCFPVELFIFQYFVN